MNIKPLHILAFWAVLSACCFSACSDREELPMPVPQETGAFRFSVQSVQTRLGYNFEETTFTDGELIGCVIAEVNSDDTYTYLRNSAWQYRASDGMLIFQYYWGWKQDATQTWHGVWNKISSNDTEVDQEWNGTTIVKIITKDPSKNDDSYLYSPYLSATGNESKKLKFFFYYPYIDSELLETDYTRVIGITGSKYQALAYPNCANEKTNIPSSATDGNWNSITLTGEVADTYQQNNNKYNWREFPCFVNHTQGNVNAAGSINDIRLQNSDFLWVASPEISAESQSRISLLFQKKTATILVYSETQLNNIYFMPSDKQTLQRGRKIDLGTGELSSYTYTPNSWEGTLQDRNMYFNQDEHIIPYYRGQNVDEGTYYYFYRLVLPAQEKCRFKMHINLTDGSTEIDKDINLSDDNNLTELKEGYLYSIRIAKDGSTIIQINDWIDGAEEDLEEVTTQP